MNSDTPDNNIADNAVSAAIDKVLPDCSEKERSDVSSQILKQLKSFRIIDSVDTDGVEPLFCVREYIESRSER